MNISRLEKIYAITITIIFGGIILHAPLSVGLGVLFPDYEVLIKSWKEILMAILVPLAVVIVSKRQLWSKLTFDWLFRLIVAYAILHLILVAVYYEGGLMAAAGLAIDLRYILYFGLVYVLLLIWPDYRRLLVKIAVIGAAIVVGFAALQLFLPADSLKYLGYSNETIAPYLTVDKNPDYIRVNSTLRGPNPLGAYAVIVLSILIAALVRRRLSRQLGLTTIGVGLLTLCSLIALWISYSRSAVVAGLISVGAVLASTVARRLSRKVWIGLAIAICALVGGLIAGQNSTFVSNVLLHENPEGGSVVSSNDGHVESLVMGLTRMQQQPFGAGIGSTGSASLQGDAPTIIENQYLFIAHESGWLGFVLFLAVFVLIMMRLWKSRQDWLSLGVFASGVGMALIGLLLPVWADDTVAIIWWGLAAIALSKGVEND
jgi:hypothetical protein